MARYIRLFISGLLFSSLGCGMIAKAEDTPSPSLSDTPSTALRLEYQPSIRIQPKSRITLDIQTQYPPPTDNLSLGSEHTLANDDHFTAAVTLGEYNRSKLKRWVTPGVYWKPIKGMELGAGLSFGLGDNDSKGKGLRFMTRFKYQWN